MANNRFKVDNGLVVTGNAEFYQRIDSFANAHFQNDLFVVSGNLVVNGTLIYANVVVGLGGIRAIADQQDVGNTTNRFNIYGYRVQVDDSLVPLANGVAAGNTTRRFEVFANNLNATTITIGAGGSINSVYYSGTASNANTVGGLVDTGIVVKTGPSTAVARTIVTSTDGVTITNGNGVSGNPAINIALQSGLFSNTSGIYVNASSVAVGTLPISRGGTGGPDRVTGLNNLLPIQNVSVASYVLQTDGTNASWVLATGPTGYSGSQGIIGFTGSQGIIGFTGSAGTNGFWGSVGFTGSRGIIGFTGSQGVVGFTGSAGTNGFWGSVGYTGSASTVIGFTGSQGQIGYTGSFGYTAVQQGGGAGQATNKLYVGWSESGLRLQVDSTNFGNVWPIGITGAAATVTGVALQSGLGTTSSPTFASLSISSDTGSNYGAGWSMNSLAAGAINKNKHFRIDPVGTLEYINSVYTSVIAGLTDAGTFNAVNLTSGGNQVLHAGNYTGYAPSLTGSGASGTWGINVTGSSATTTLAAKASTLAQGGGNGAAMTFNWSGLGGQPTWLWGGSDGVNFYVYNPSNFSVSYAATAGNATTVTGITSLQVTNALGYTPYNSTNPAGYLTGISSLQVTNALGYTPYNSTNPSGYISGISSLQVTNALGYTPYNSSNPSGYISGISSLQVTNALGYTPYNSTNPSGYISSVPNASTQVSSLGVGTGASGTGGEIRATNEITAYYSSDKKFKENIVPIESALEKLSMITGVMFDWTDEYIESRGGEDGYFVRKHDTGIIAQEVQSVLPEVVATREDGTLAVKYEKMMGLVIQAINELSVRVDKLKD